jgi:hypothetical protein
MGQHASPLSSPEPAGMIRTADVLGALSAAADLALGMPEGHAARSCYLGMAIADRLGLSLKEKATVYYSELLMDAGCTAWAGYVATAIMGDEIEARRDFYFYRDARNPLDVLGWLQRYMAVGAPAHIRARHILDFTMHGKEFQREGLQNTAEVACHFAERLGMPDEVQSTLWLVFEQWDGKGPNRAQGDAIPGRHTPRTVSERSRGNCGPTGHLREVHADHGSASSRWRRGRRAPQLPCVDFPQRE